MRSCLYEGRVYHRRSGPIEHGFRYGVAYLYLDLAELDAVFGGGRLWSHAHPAPIRFRRADYLGPRELPLGDAVRQCITEQGHTPPDGPTRLLTQPRYFGYLMNPVSFYFCFDRNETLRFVIADVTNTPWGERHAYVLPYEPGVRPRIAKEFHVSPFLPMDLDYRFALATPGERLNLQIENFRGADRVFGAALHLRRRELSRWSPLRLLTRYPLMTHRIWAGIYWQALRLWSKGCRYYPHPPLNDPPQSTSHQTAV